MWALAHASSRQRPELSPVCFLCGRQCGFTRSVHAQPQVLVAFCAFQPDTSLASAIPALLWVHSAGQEGSTWTSSFTVSCGGVTVSRGLVCFYVLLESDHLLHYISFRLCPGTRSHLRHTVQSPPWSWFLNPVLHQCGIRETGVFTCIRLGCTELVVKSW